MQRICNYIIYKYKDKGKKYQKKNKHVIMLIMLYNNVIKCIKINAPALEIYRNKENIQKHSSTSFSMPLTLNHGKKM